MQSFLLSCCRWRLNYKIDHAGGSRSPPGAPVRLRRCGEAEIGIGFTVVLAAASLTSQPPAVDLPNDRATAAQSAGRLLPRVPRLETPPVSALSPSDLQIWNYENKFLVSGQAFVPGASYTPPTPGDIAPIPKTGRWVRMVSGRASRRLMWRSTAFSSC
jgi:hypothetical protein